MTKIRQLPFIFCSLLIIIVIIVSASGCSNKASRSASQKEPQPPAVAFVENAPEQTKAQQSQPQVTRQPDDQEKVAEAALAIDFSAEDTSPVLSAEQLRSAEMGLESFRVFCAHFKLQSDQETLNSVKQPTLDYIKKYIDPILKRKHRLQDNDYSRSIITLYYLKAYLFWIFNESKTAHEIIDQINQEVPQTLKAKNIYHIDRGEVKIEEALQQLERLIEDNPS